MSSEDAPLKQLGSNIRHHRKERGLTQEKLSELCEFDPTYISLLEGGKRNPSFLTVVKIASCLECTVSEITEDV